MERLENRALLTAVWLDAASMEGNSASSDAELALTAPPELESGSELEALTVSSNWAVGPHPQAFSFVQATPTNQIEPFTTIFETGPSSNRVDIVFLGDGYTAPQIETNYVNHINSMLNHMFNSGEDPFPRYANFFNSHRINVISNESGADKPGADPPVYVDTALDARYWCSNIERLICISNSKANAAISAALAEATFDVDMRLVTVNDTKYGGSGGVYAVYAGGSSSAPEIALHELGHSFSNLADEYANPGSGTYTGSEPREVNVTTDPSGAKWSPWLGYSQPVIGTISAYEGGRYFEGGIYRPSLNSKMRSLGRPFDAVSREKLILDIYAIVDPLDDFRENTQPVVEGNPELWVQPVDPGVIKTEWYVDGTLVPGASGETFRPLDFGFAAGDYLVTARSYDPVDWVRTNRDRLEQSVAWDVTVLPTPTIVGISVNAGANQRSSLDRVTIEFGSEVEIDFATSEPFRVTRRGDPTVSIPYIAEVGSIGDRTVVSLTFDPSSSWTNLAGSLVDGAYELRIDGAGVSATGVFLDADGDGVPGGIFRFGATDADKFYRKFGDSDGNGLVNLADFAALRSAFASSIGDLAYRPELDADGNGFINLFDFAEFRSRFGT